jgi:glycosyltransferase involved in cell wall biosynthesis
MIIVISDFDLNGSGYMNIAVPLCNQLVERGYTVKALGIGYDPRQEHFWDFSIIPVATNRAFQHMPAMMQNLMHLDSAGQIEKIEAVIVALDIPLQERCLGFPRSEDIPYMGVFPLDGGPLTTSWANVLARMDSAMVISKFGLGCMQEKGVEGIHFPVGLDTESWRPPSEEAGERKKLREAMGIEEGEFIVLTVADNQERKNLSAAASIIAGASEKMDAIRWFLVTRPNNTVGWRLNDMFIDKGIMDKVVLMERGLSFDKLWTLHAIADAFMLTPKAEGLSMPALEAMATNTPVILTDCTALTEHLFEDPINRTGQRGYPLKSAFVHEDPWGNTLRHYVSVEHGIETLLYVADPANRAEREEFADRALEYVRSRTWSSAGDVAQAEIERIKELKKPKPEPESAGMGMGPISGEFRVPTLPHKIPIQSKASE